LIIKSKVKLMDENEMTKKYILIDENYYSWYSWYIKRKGKVKEE